MTNSKFIYRVAAGISVLACCVSCVVTDETLGSNLIPIEQTYKFYTERIPIDQIEVRMADSLSGYSSSRLVIGAVSDEDYGMTTRSSAITLVPLFNDSLEIGRNPEFKNFRFAIGRDTLSSNGEDQLRILQNINVYELDRALDASKDYDCNKPLQPSANKVAEGTPIYNGGDSLVFYFTKEYGEKYDWDALFERAKHMNEQNTIELEKWDIFKTPYSALCGIAETLYRLYSWASVNGQEDYFTKTDRKVIKIMRRCYKKKYEPFGGKTRHRAFLWGPSAVYYTDFPTWIQNCWGINIVLNMDSTMGHNMISTTDPEQAIKDLALFSEKGVMRHHAVGGWDNVNAVWEWAKNFNCDMVLCNDNVACKGMNGVHALLEEQARDLGFHFIFIEHDLEDSRTVSRQDMRKCVNNYMSVVLNEQPLDPTIVEFDDSEAY